LGSFVLCAPNNEESAHGTIALQIWALVQIAKCGWGAFLNIYASIPQIPTLKATKTPFWLDNELVFGVFLKLFELCSKNYQSHTSMGCYAFFISFFEDEEI
jgi:hypothetical protein